MTPSRKNYLCNFRAPSQEWFNIWQKFKEETRNLGLDVCFVTLTLIKSWLEALSNTISVSQINTHSQIIILYQTNSFNYIAGKPRREPLQLDCSTNYSKSTIIRRALQAYILQKAKELNRSFSYMDFPEIPHNSFRKLILELKKQGKILPLEQRTNPRFYIPTEWKDLYPPVTQNNTVKPTATSDCSSTENRGDDAESV